MRNGLVILLLAGLCRRLRPGYYSLMEALRRPKRATMEGVEAARRDGPGPHLPARRSSRR